MFLYLITGLALLGVTDAAESVKRDSHDVDVSYYGRLSLHHSFTDQQDLYKPLWHIQGGEVVLSNAQYTFRVPTQVDGSFVLHDIPYGTYHLQAEYADHIYPTVRVDVTQKTSHGNTRPLIRTYVNEAILQQLQGTGVEESSPVIIPYTGMHEYYVPREQYSVWSILGNPMILMMFVSMGLVGVMQMMPEEQKKSMRELQKARKQAISGGDTDLGRQQCTKGQPAVSTREKKQK
uniref:ER membrane protein complex subunit 7 beta-sandwich domain-containing protein n=1 Tax=Trypanosoma congolense (strain IL3000) TaxID=1068625 RepID=G0UPH9_TRYCI|nr:conserved hypothetical protein [Trypanosoma congolense IL3000]